MCLSCCPDGSRNRPLYCSSPAGVVTSIVAPWLCAHWRTVRGLAASHTSARTWGSVPGGARAWVQELPDDWDCTAPRAPQDQQAQAQAAHGWETLGACGLWVSHRGCKRFIGERLRFQSVHGWETEVPAGSWVRDWGFSVGGSWVRDWGFSRLMGERLRVQCRRLMGERLRVQCWRLVGERLSIKWAAASPVTFICFGISGSGKAATTFDNHFCSLI